MVRGHRLAAAGLLRLADDHLLLVDVGDRGAGGHGLLAHLAGVVHVVRHLLRLRHVGLLLELGARLHHLLA